jgi:uridine kinase
MSRVVPGTPRERVQARLPEGRLLEAPPGTPLAEVLAVAAADGPPSAAPMAAVVDRRLCELWTPLRADADVVPVTLADADGQRIYRRSLVFLLVVAAGEVFPEAEVHIEHAPTTAAGFYCTVRGRRPFDADQLAQIEARMREIVASDAPIQKTEVPLAEAVALFRGRGEEDKARLLGHRTKRTLPLYALRGRLDYLQGYMVPSAGYLRHFALAASPPGFMLQFPHQGDPATLPPATPYPKLFQVFEEAGRWLERLGVRDAGALNDAIADGRLPQVSLVAEALHEARIARIAAEVVSAPARIKVVLVAGPSSSGKTTFSKRLAVQLLALGLRPFPLGLDEYFFDRERTPHGPDGKPDYESLTALDLELLQQHLLELLAGRTVELPHYDFISGQRRPGPSVSLEPDNVLIIEGIHGLNPELLPALPQERVYRVYVSALTQLNLDRHNRVSTTDTRLVRRVVRDAASRGYTAADTIQRWPAVTGAEKRHIFPFQEHADAIFNSALVHELAVLRPLAEPLLLQVRPWRPEYLEANRILSFLQWFRPVGSDSVPDNSILREFVGGSILEGFRLWPRPTRAGPA